METIKAIFAECTQHGRYQENILDDKGIVRWRTECPDCFQNRQIAQKIVKANIPPRFKDKTFESYVCDTQAKKHALSVLHKYAQEFSENTSNCIILGGGVGTGKTHLAISTIKYVIGKGYTARYDSVMNIIQSIRETWGGNNITNNHINTYTSVNLLAIDEVGVQYGSESEQIILFNIINHRYEKKLPTIIISNVPVQSKDQNQKTLKTYMGERSYDRLKENGGKLVIFDWDSHRQYC